MENLINYYYNLTIINTKKFDNYVILSTDTSSYLLCEVYDENNLKEVLDYLNKTNILYHLLVLSKDNKLTIEYDNKFYALFKIRNESKINIFSFNNLIVQGNLNWGTVWVNRVDTLQEQIKEIVDINEVRYAMDYYISLAELAISYFNNLKEIYSSNELKFTLQHYNINSPLNYIEYLNPANICFDLSVKDMAEYIKNSFFNDILTNNEILSLLDSIELNDALANYLMVRLIYPSYQFKIFDKYIETKDIGNKFFVNVKKANEYEHLLYEIYNKLKFNYNINAYIYFFKDQR